MLGLYQLGSSVFITQDMLRPLSYRPWDWFSMFTCFYQVRVRVARAWTLNNNLTIIVL